MRHIRRELRAGASGYANDKAGRNAGPARGRHSGALGGAYRGRAGALALDAVSAALGGERPHVREIRSSGFDFAVVAAPFGAENHEIAGVMLAIATDALTLRRLNMSLEGKPSIEVVSRVA